MNNPNQHIPDNLIERLQYEGGLNRSHPTPARKGCAEAATALESAQREIAELREILGQCRQVLATYQPDNAPTFYMEAIWNAESALNKERNTNNA